MVVHTGSPLDAPRPSSSPAMASTLAGSTTTWFVPRLLDLRPHRARVALPLLPPPSLLTQWCSHSCHRVLHADVVWSTATPLARHSPSHLAARLPPSSLCTRAPLAGYCSSPQGRPWPPTISCFKCFRRMFSSVSFGCCECCNGYICMLQTYVSYYKQMFQVFQTYVSSVSSGCCRSRLRCCITCMLQAYVFKCFIRML